MKEIIVLEIPKDMCDNCNGCDKPTSALVECYLEEPRQAYETVKVPETWEELKELCKDIKEVTITEEGHINVDLVYFTKDGEIYTYVEGVLTSSIFLPVSKDRTPQQMWQIIMGLLGE